MTRQGEELFSLVDIEIREEDRKACKKYMNKMYGLRLFIIVPYIVIIYYVFLFITNHDRFTQRSEIVYCIAVGFLIVFLILYCINKRNYLSNLQRILRTECHPEHLLSWYGVLASYYKREKGWGEIFYNIGCALYYMGRIEDAKKIIFLLDKHCKYNTGYLFRYLLSSHINLYEKKQDALKRDCNSLKQVSRRILLGKSAQGLVNSRFLESAILDQELEGNYEKVYGMCEAAKSYNNSMLFQVKKNYYMYQAAMKMGNTELAKIHRDFVLKHGETLWYKTDLENECR